MRLISMATRGELLKATILRYQAGSRDERSRMLDEFAALTGYHRKHAMRLLRGPLPKAQSPERPERRRYGTAVCDALVLLWEASDRICGKRLKPLLPILIASMENHGHLVLDAQVREELLRMSAATVDRGLRDIRSHANKRPADPHMVLPLGQGASACSSMRRHESVPNPSPANHGSHRSLNLWSASVIIGGPCPKQAISNVEPASLTRLRRASSTSSWAAARTMPRRLMHASATNMTPGPVFQ